MIQVIEELSSEGIRCKVSEHLVLVSIHDWLVSSSVVKTDLRELENSTCSFLVTPLYIQSLLVPENENKTVTIFN